ncbi:unnamed protein product [Cochlearia groenlandica]
MKESLAKCKCLVQERYDNVLEANPIYLDDLDITNLPLNESEVSKEPTKKIRFLQRAKRIDQSLRFGREKEETRKTLSRKEGLKPRKVVRFQLENNKIFEPKKKPLEEKEEEEVVSVKIKMHEAQRLLKKCKNDIVLGFEHVMDRIAHVPIHQRQVVVVACNK